MKKWCPKQPQKSVDERTILRDRNRFERQNREIAQLIVAQPELAGGCVVLLEWACMFVEIPEEEW